MFGLRKSRLEMGVTAKDKVTGFVGVITAHTQYISGCSQILLVPTVKDNKKQDAEWFDEQRCERVGSNQVVLFNDETPGCDVEAPKR